MDHVSVNGGTLHPLEHQVLRKFREHEWTSSPLLVAISGGRDSVALGHILWRIQPLLKCDIAFAHVHHGETQNNQQEEFRRCARDFVDQWAQKLGIPYLTRSLDSKSVDAPLRSESQYRDFRYSQLMSLRDSWALNAKIVLAHHLEDQLETRLIQLIRGTGEQGLKGMSFENNRECIRPLLEISRFHLEAYLEEFSIDFLDDPSNKSVDPLRNWLRLEWLPLLEKKRPGALDSLARSLSNLLDGNKSEESALKFSDYILESRIHHPRFLELSRYDQRRVLARFMREQGFAEYGRSHIEEIIKRLDTSKKNHTFILLRRCWQVSPQWIEVSLDK
ncbi:MAG: tRNA lysidine(34) synthetase TilS [Bdellovibrionales bacterium]|nr:tRNA lysidine(34) synthetase TilS [Bdellovibrionales bacterium]